jgi:hyperosmotically inducible periplasmic protein
MQRRAYTMVMAGLGAVALLGTAALPAAAQQSTGEKVKQESREAGQEVKQGARQAGQEAKQESREAQRSGRPLSDAWLTAKTKLALLGDDRVSGTAINVDTKDGVVTLKGQVADQAEKQHAVELARKVEGVKDVRDQLTLKSQSGATASSSPAAPGTSGAAAPAKPNDDQLARQVRAQITQAWPQGQFKAEGDTIKGPRDQKIEVETDDGIVTLKGKVNDVQDIVRAAEAARKVPGVRAVKTKIESGQPS